MKEKKREKEAGGENDMGGEKRRMQYYYIEAAADLKERENTNNVCVYIFRLSVVVIGRAR